MKANKRLAVVAFVLTAWGCAPVPKPAVFAEVDVVHESAAAKEARALAPTAYAHADKLRTEAKAAFDAGDVAGSQILAERAIAAYAHALVYARIARAESGAKDSDAQLATTQAEIATLDTEQARVAAEVTALEARIRVSKDAQPIQASGITGHPREAARTAAAKSLVLEAKLLCMGARLLLPSLPQGVAPVGAPERSALVSQLDEAELFVSKTNESLAAGGNAPIDLATRARAACLSVLTGMRRAMTPVSRAPGGADALLGEISATHLFSPLRDERGIVVTLRDVFNGDKLSPTVTNQIEALGKIAAANRGFPLTAVVHQEKDPANPSPKDEAAAKARAEALSAAFRSAGVPSLSVVQAGTAAPVVDPRGGDRKRNARVEIVFVSPETF